eukprot:9868614-Alexandrium_andersonii.AAC.1
MQGRVLHSLNPQALGHRPPQVQQCRLMIGLERDPMMVPEHPDAGDGLVDRIVAQAPFAQRWVRQDRARSAALDDQDNE